MEVIKDLPEVFEEFAEQRKKSFLAVKELKDKGVPVVGAYCTYFPQEIAPYLTDMFALSRELPGYALFYNGPRCGASAPDHQHFQTVPAASLPVVGDYGRLKQTHAVQYDRTGRAVTYVMRDYLRTLFCIESAHADALEIAKNTYVDGDIHSEKNKALLAGLEQLPTCCVESGDWLEKQRAMFEEKGVFNPRAIDGMIRNLRAMNDKGLYASLQNDEAKLLALVEQYFHCG